MVACGREKIYSIFYLLEFVSHLPPARGTQAAWAPTGATQYGIIQIEREATMRNLSETIDKMLAVIPAEQASLIERLESIKQSSLFAAPEMQASWWRICRCVLMVEFTENGKLSLPEEWQKQVAATFSEY